jgi:hypothetical protein
MKTMDPMKREGLPATEAYATTNSSPVAVIEKKQAPHEEKTADAAIIALMCRETLPPPSDLTTKKISKDLPEKPHFPERVTKILVEFGFSETVTQKELEENFSKLGPDELLLEMSPAIVEEMKLQGSLLAFKVRCQFEENCPGVNLDRMSPKEIIADEKILFETLQYLVTFRRFQKEMATLHFSAPIRQIFAKFGLPETLSAKELEENFQQLSSENISIKMTPEIKAEGKRLKHEIEKEFKKNCPGVDIDTMTPAEIIADEKVLFEALQGLVKIREFKQKYAAPK